MPIRFRCAYCNQLMGISHRKMGTIVRCPKCSGQVVVPQIEGTPDDDEPRHDGEMAAAVKALEDPELEMLLAGAAHEAAGQGKRKAKRRGPPRAFLEIDVEPLDPLPPPLPAAAPESPIPSLSSPAPIVPSPAAPSLAASAPAFVMLPRWVIGSVATAILFLLGLAFFVGFVLGKQAGH